MFEVHLISCNRCHAQIKLVLDRKDFAAWKHGLLIQHAFPYLTPDEREILISGLCGLCFDDLYEDR